MDHQLSFTSVKDGGTIYGRATSVCFYRDPKKFCHEKHVERLVGNLPRIKEDVLVFTDSPEELPSVFYDQQNFRIFQITKPLPGYQRHFYRYAGAHRQFFCYPWVWFTGTDTIVPTTRAARLSVMADVINCPFLISNSPNTVVCPNLWAAPKGRELLWSALSDAEFESDWNCDDKFFHQWFLNNDIPALLGNSNDGMQNGDYLRFITSLIEERNGSLVVRL